MARWSSPAPTLATICAVLTIRAVTAVAAPVTLSCSAGLATTSYDLPSEGAPLSIVFGGHQSGWLEIAESGQTVKIRGDSLGELLDIDSPLRFGWHWLAIEPGKSFDIRRFQSNRAFGRVAITVHCLSTQIENILPWLKQASELASRLNTPVSKSTWNALLGDLEKLADAAPDQRAKALARHLLAQALLVNDRNTDAASAFEAAETAWLAVNDRDRALVARVARVEDLRRIGAYAEVLTLSEPSNDRVKSSDAYFRARLQGDRCLTLNNLGRHAESERCYEGVLKRLEALDERAELVDLLYDFANLQMARGRFEKAQAIAERTVRAATGIESPLVHGHVQYLLTALASRRGEIAQSLSFADAALKYFAEAHTPRWQANVLLHVAVLYAALGAQDDAYSTLAAAVERLSTRDALARIATAAVIFSDLERERQRTGSARLWARVAESIFDNLKMPVEREAAQLSVVDLNIQSDNLHDAQSGLGVHVDVPSTYQSRRLLLTAELAIKQHRLAAARVAIDALRNQPISLREQVRLAQLDAEYRQRSEDPLGAQQLLLDAARRVRHLAARARSPILSYVIERQIVPLQRTAFRLAWQQQELPNNSAPLVEMVWTWLSLTTPHRRHAVTDRRAIGDAERFDRAVANELLLRGSGQRSAAELSANHELLSLLAQSGSDRSNEPDVETVPLTAFQQQLDADSVFLAFVDTRTRGALLYVTRRSATLLTSADPDRIRHSLSALRELLLEPGTRVDDIRAAAQDLSMQLLSGLPARAPKRLYVFAEEPLNGVPWSLLTWPGEPSALIDSTAISLVRLDDNRSRKVLPDTRTLHAFVAAQEQEPSATLPTLVGAQKEVQQITQLLSGDARSVVRSDNADRKSILAALAESGAWVHIAAHGVAHPQRIGYAGIWLESSAHDVTPPFLSWLDILDHGVSADLVVLNACQLGDSGNAVNGNLSFAAATSRAGASHVIAALWPISDSASTLWVSTFYAALGNDPERDPARALLAAQQRLRAERAFRHPFFWAGMQSIDRLSIRQSTTNKR